MQSIIPIRSSFIEISENKNYAQNAEFILGNIHNKAEASWKKCDTKTFSIFFNNNFSTIRDLATYGIDGANAGTMRQDLKRIQELVSNRYRKSKSPPLLINVHC